MYGMLRLDFPTPSFSWNKSLIIAYPADKIFWWLMPLLYHLIQVIKEFNLLTSFLEHLQNCQTSITLSIYKHNLLVYSNTLTFNWKNVLDILAKLILLSEILWKHIDSHLLYLHYKINITPQSWWRYHHSQCWSKLKSHLSILFRTSLVPRMMPLKSITVYREAFYHPYFCYGYKSLVYLVTLKLWYSYSYWLHILLLFAWMLFFDPCPCLDCCLVLDLACITSTLNITLTFSVAGRILGILHFWGLLSQLFFETCLDLRSFNWLWN